MSSLKESVFSHKGKRADTTVLNSLGPIPRDYDLTGLECSVWGFYTSPGDSNMLQNLRTSVP